MPARYSVLASATTEEGITSWETQPLKLSFADLISKLTGARSDEVATASIGAAPKVVLASKQVEQPLYGASTRSPRDHRFSSVVVVESPKGVFGAGFFVRPDVVLTNWHVIEGTGFASITTFDEQKVTGKIIATDIARDLALIRVPLKGRPVEFPKGGDIEPGTSVEAIGHPKGLMYSITRGVVSGLRVIPSRYGAGTDVAFIQTDTPLSPGNSGGPLFRGNDVVGVNDWALNGGGSQNLNFAIDYREVLRFIRNSL